MSGGAARPTPAAEEHFFADRQSQAQELARAVGAALRAALVARPRAALAVPGGSTPRAFLSALGREPLDWPRVTVTLTDERWVPVDHPDSNERLVRQELFAHAAAAARWVGLYTGDADPSAAAPACERAIAELLPFDVVVLGMGEDGHIASLFPNAPSITAALDPTGERLCGPGVGAGAGSPRLSLYAPALFSARRCCLLIAGPEKLAVYRRVLAGATAADLPIAALLENRAAALEVYWAP